MSRKQWARGEMWLTRGGHVWVSGSAGSIWTPPKCHVLFEEMLMGKDRAVISHLFLSLIISLPRDSFFL